METNKPASTKFSVRANWLNIATLIVLFSLIALPRVLPFPHAFLAPDEMKIGLWVSEMANALIEGDWEKTAITNNPYPAVTVAWIEVIQVKIFRLFTGPLESVDFLTDQNEITFAALPRQRLALAFINTAIVLAIFWLVQQFYNRFVAVTAVILMAIDPFFLTESRVFRTEGLTTGLMMLSALTVVLYARDRQIRWLVLSAVLAGLAGLTRVSAFYVFLFAGLVLLTWSLMMGERRVVPLLKQIIYDIFRWFLIAGATFIILWPALWLDILNGPDKLYTAIAPVFMDTGRVWEKGVYFQGHTMGEVDPGPMFYLYALAYRTTPILWIGLGAAFGGGVFFGIQALRNKHQESRAMPSSPYVTRSTFTLAPHAWPVTFLILSYIFLYFLAINLSATKIDRYLIAMLPGLFILAALGFWWIIARFFAGSETEWGVKLKKWGVWGVLLVSSALFSLPHHPYYYTYWNPLLGGGQAAVKILPVTFRLGIDPLIDHLNSLSDVSTMSLSGPELELDQDCQVIFSGHCVKHTEFLKGDYFLITRYAVQHELNLANIRTIIPDLKLRYKYENAGVDYAWLYKMPAGIQYVGQWLDLDAGIFSGYKLSATEVGAGELVEVTLFWQNGEKSGWQFDDSELFVKVLDETGQVKQIVPAQLKPEFEPYSALANEILVFIAPLNFLPDTPLGSYTIEIGLRLKGTGEETLHFSLLDLANTITVNRGVLTTPAANEFSIPYRHKQALGGTGLTLLGYDVSLASVSSDEAKRVSHLYFYWQAEKIPDDNYDLALALLDDEGQTVATWRRELAPEIHPVTTWQSGEIVKLPFPVELADPLSVDSCCFVLSVFSSGGQESEAVTIIDLPLSEDVIVARPEIGMQHRLDNITFDDHLDLLGYDLRGTGDASEGTLFVTLYWLNRQPAKFTEGRVEVWAENGEIIAQQDLPVSRPAGALTWQSANYYELPLDAWPSSIAIRTRPIGSKEWYKIETLPSPAEQVVITDILNKIVITN